MFFFFPGRANGSRDHGAADSSQMTKVDEVGIVVTHPKESPLSLFLSAPGEHWDPEFHSLETTGKPLPSR